jgi:hypothetical protein
MFAEGVRNWINTAAAEAGAASASRRAATTARRTARY